VESKNVKKIVMKISELPAKENNLARLRQRECNDTDYDKTTDNLIEAFDWTETTEDFDYWDEWHLTETDGKGKVIDCDKPPKHYDNSKGSLYKFCEEHELNSYEFDIIKRVMRCRKKGLFLEDLEKTKFAIDLYIKEQLEKNK
jgi:hypothetical protein